MNGQDRAKYLDETVKHANFLACAVVSLIGDDRLQARAIRQLKTALASAYDQLDALALGLPPVEGKEPGDYLPHLQRCRQALAQVDELLTLY